MVAHNRLQCSALAFKLSYRNLVSMMSERGINLAHHDDSPMGAALHAGNREAVAAVRSPGGWLLADG